ncbi:MAG: quinone-dependent dihydroorotate dehydrogenase, partial [Nocardioides sp.]
RTGPADPIEVMGLRFDNRLGLAAGFDKNAIGIDALAALGFGHIEIGTVTGEPQSGNPKPRLFRLPADRAIVNRMGFNNGGAEAVARRLAARTAGRGADTGSASPGPVLGVNIGKTKAVPEEHAVADYCKSAALLAPYADYLVVNVSSPNTPGLRNLQAVEKLQPLLESVRRAADQATERARRHRVPLLVKIAPDLVDADIVATAELATAISLDGIIATNTTTARRHLRTNHEDVLALGEGGLSGPPVTRRSMEVLKVLRSAVPAGMALISVGGISGPEEARRRIAAGAHLVQAYTGFVYGGPAWPRQVARALATVHPGASR